MLIQQKVRSRNAEIVIIVIQNRQLFHFSKRIENPELLNKILLPNVSKRVHRQSFILTIKGDVRIDNELIKKQLNLNQFIGALRIYQIVEFVVFLDDDGSVIARVVGDFGYFEG
jgi:hypothetical protein